MWFLRRHDRLAYLAVPLLILAAVSSPPAHSAGITHYVANNGADSTECGRKSQPCRSIGRAIQQANDGDTILVGPGFYGDTNNDGDFSDVGDEFLDASFPTPCLVCVNKQIRLFSTHGAELTVIDGSGTEAFGPTAGVSIRVSNVSFGTESRGFTVRDMSSFGVQVGPGTENVTVAGNHATNNGVVGETSGIGFQVSVGTGIVRLRGNLASNNNLYGFLAIDGGLGGYARVVDNVARDNREFAYWIAAGNTPGYAVIGNVATSSGLGFSLNGRGLLFRRNVVTNNRQAIIISGDNAINLLLVESSIIGNDAGILIAPNVPGPINIHRNNIYGNVGGNSTTELNCAISNQSGRIDARNNFWGLPDGPGPDPADNAGRGGGCDESAEAQTLVKPFATKAFPIQTKSATPVKAVQEQIVAE